MWDYVEKIPKQGGVVAEPTTDVYLQDYIYVM